MKKIKLAQLLFLVVFLLGGNNYLRAETSGKSSDPASQTGSPNVNITTLDSDPVFADDWDPFAEMERMQRHMSHFFNRSMKRFSEMSRDSLLYQPDVDIQEKAEKYVVRMDLPGMRKEQIKIDVTEDALTISGERKTQSEEENARDGYYRMERSFGSFHRTIPLDNKVKTEEVSAKYEDGVLEIDLPKIESKTAATKSVKIQ